MEELNNEIVELDNNDVIVETPNEETGMSGALVAGAIGGLFAVAVGIYSHCSEFPTIKVVAHVSCAFLFEKHRSG